MDRRDIIKLIVRNFGNKFSTDLGIDLETGDEAEVFKWFVASMLFGARITEKIAIKTYRTFEREDILSPKAVVETGWDGLVRLLDSGGYTRYDFKTATKLLDIVDSLMRRYDGELVEIHRLASDSRDLENRLKELGKGVGDVTVGIFLRELRGTWKKADPLPQPLTVLASNRLGFTRLRGRDQFERGKILEDLKRIWIENRLKGKDFVNFETALVRIGKDVFRRRKKLSLTYPFPRRSK